jgi:hypothetical protein
MMSRAAAARNECDVGGEAVSTAEPPASRPTAPLPVDTPDPSLATTRPRVAAIDMLKVIWSVG